MKITNVVVIKTCNQIFQNKCQSDSKKQKASLTDES